MRRRRGLSKDQVEVIVHPLYISGYALVNDVALLRLDTPVNVGVTLPIATPADAARFAPGVDAQIAGWGNLLPQTGVQQPDIVHKAVVQIVDNAGCNNRYDHVRCAQRCPMMQISRLSAMTQRLSAMNCAGRLQSCAGERLLFWKWTCVLETSAASFASPTIGRRSGARR